MLYNAALMFVASWATAGLCLFTVAISVDGPPTRRMPDHSIRVCPVCLTVFAVACLCIGPLYWVAEAWAAFSGKRTSLADKLGIRK